MKVSGLKEGDICDSPKFRTIHFEGCQKCKQGIIGRVIVMEYLKKDDIKSFMDKSHIASEVSSVSPVSLKKECLRLASQGIVDIKEVFQVS